MRKLKSYLLIGSTVCCGALKTFADEPAGQIEDIIVVAQKRAENMQDVPATVFAMSSQALENRQVQDLTDIQTYVPSMVVGQLYGANLITLRGISTGLTSGSEDPSVAVHINGVYQARSRTIDLVMMDLERVEVMAGPQGTLYGRNATGGVVNYIMKGPSEDFEGQFAASVGNYDNYGVKGSISGPLTDKIGGRLSGLFYEREGYTDNLYNGSHDDKLEERGVTSGRLAISFAPLDTLKFDLDAMYADTDSSSLFAALHPPGDAALAAYLVPLTSEHHKTYSELDSKLDSTYTQVSLTASWNINDEFDLKFISGYQKYSDEMVIDLDATPIAGVDLTQDHDSDTYTQELNLTGRLFDGRLTSVLGVFYFDDDLGIEGTTHFGLFGLNRLFEKPTSQISKSYSVFTDNTLQIGDRTRVIAGIRFNKDEKETDQAFCLAGTPCPLFSGDLDWTAWTPRLGIQFDASDNVMVYANYQEGFKAGGFVANTNGDDYDPEHLRGGEIGVKSELLDRRLRLNAAAWYYKYEDLQVQQVVGLATFAVENAAKAILEGIEVSMTAALTPQLTADVALMAQDATYDEFLNCNQTVARGACTTPETLILSDLSGNWLSRAAPYSANVGLEYSFDLSNGAEMRLRGESYWSGEVYYDEFNSSGMKQDAYSVQNAFLSYTSADGRYEVRAFGKNLLDEEYIVSGFFLSATTVFMGNWAPPRTYGAEFTVNF